MSQKFSLYLDMTPFENIRFYLGIYNVPARIWKARTQEVLKITRLTNMQDRLTRELPPGWRQRLALGCALLHQPKLLFLDEPTSGEGVTVFVTTHYMEEARHCDRVVMINEGKIVAGGPPREIIRKVLPDQPDADLNAAFVKLMARRKP